MNFNKIIQVFKIKDLRKKILFVLAMFLLFRLMANIPVPGVDAQNLQGFFDRFQMFGLLNVFTGGTLSKLSIIMLGIGPYITATIILQLLTMIFPALEKIYKEEGEAGRKRFNQYGRILTVPLAVMQGYAMLNLLQRTSTGAGGGAAIGKLSPVMMLSALVTVTAGTMFLVWLGEMITEKGIGNGVSLLIFAGIVAGIPSSIYQFAFNWDPSQLPSYLLFFAASFIIIIGVVLVTEARRNIPVSYAKRVRGNKIYGGASTYLPLNVNPAGVIPIIFALSILLFPQMIGSFLSNAGGIVGSIARSIAGFQSHQIAWGATYFILVFVFTYFYTMVTFDPKAISSNLKKMGGFVPGIRPGESTSSFLSYILNRVLFIGAIFLSVIAIMPYLIKGATGVTSFSFLVGGTSLLIVVSVVLDTVKQINAQLQMREYETL
ncbi:MAG: preprotein translocase subunit SecY [Candidatus Parcubacteria bacterium]|nr:preprotein translocase subunit SecY [Candidatus Parcubacteria bacterium]